MSSGVIDLTSPTPPRSKPANSCQITPRNLLSTPFPAQSLSGFAVEDDIDALLALAGTVEQPSKKPRLSYEFFQKPNDTGSKRPSTSMPKPADPLFGLSDDDAIQPSTTVAKDCFSPSKGNGDTKYPSLGFPYTDPIVFTSSAPEAGSAGNGSHEPATITIDDDDDLDTTGNARWKSLNDEDDNLADLDDSDDLDALLGVSDIRESPAKRSNSNGLSSKTNSLLASLDKASSASTTAAERAGKRKDRDEDYSEGDLEEDLVKPKKGAKKPGSSSTANKEEKEAKARERAAAKAERERERELGKEKKQKAKEEKAHQKQLEADIAEVNRLKVDKKESTPEMIIDMASSLRDTSVATQSVEYMKRLGVEYTFFSSAIANIVKWRRKTRAVFDENFGHWEPCPLFIGNEQHVLCLVSAQEFVDMALASDDPGSGIDSLETHVLRVKSTYMDCKPIYLIEGLTPWMRNNRSARNRLYQAEYLRQVSMSSQNRRRRKADATPVDDDRIEDALLQLQVTHNCLIHHTHAVPETAQWIKNFTEHVSTFPYRRERMVNNDSGFCMDVGQVKTGDDKADTFVKMLQEVNRVTASMAYGITAKYPSVIDLIRAMRANGPGVLEDVRVCCCIILHRRRPFSF